MLVVVTRVDGLLRAFDRRRRAHADAILRAADVEPRDVHLHAGNQLHEARAIGRVINLEEAGLTGARVTAERRGAGRRLDRRDACACETEGESDKHRTFHRKGPPLSRLPWTLGSVR